MLINKNKWLINETQFDDYLAIIQSTKNIQDDTKFEGDIIHDIFDPAVKHIIDTQSVTVNPQYLVHPCDENDNRLDNDFDNKMKTIYEELEIWGRNLPRNHRTTFVIPCDKSCQLYQMLIDRYELVAGCMPDFTAYNPQWTEFYASHDSLLQGTILEHGFVAIPVTNQNENYMKNLFPDFYDDLQIETNI